MREKIELLTEIRLLVSFVWYSIKVWLHTQVCALDTIMKSSYKYMLFLYGILSGFIYYYAKSKQLEIVEYDASESSMRDHVEDLYMDNGRSTIRSIIFPITWILCYFGGSAQLLKCNLFIYPKNFNSVYSYENFPRLMQT